MKNSNMSGYPEYFGIDAEKLLSLNNGLERMARTLGFKPLILPCVAQASLFVRGLGNTTDVVCKEMTLLEKEGLCLRPEGTSVAMQTWFGTNRQPVRWFYNGPMFRAERPQEGRLREFRQFGLEGIGIPYGTFDAEMVSECSLFLSSIGLKATLFVNTVGSLEERARFSNAFKMYMSKYLDVLTELERSRLENSPLRLFDNPRVELQEILKSAPKLNMFFDDNTVSQYSLFKSDLAVLGVPFCEDSSLVRGLDYYTGPVYEWKAELPGGRVVAIAAGGRYDALAKQMFGTEFPAAGMAFGLDRLLLLMSMSIKREGSSVCWNNMQSRLDSLRWAQNARRRGESAFTDSTGGKWSKQVSRSDKAGCLNAVFFGETESMSGVATIKNLDTGVQT